MTRKAKQHEKVGARGRKRAKTSPELAPDARKASEPRAKLEKPGKPGKPGKSAKANKLGKSVKNEKPARQDKPDRKLSKREKRAVSDAAQSAAAQPLLNADLDELQTDGDDLQTASEDAPELGIGARVVAPNVRFEGDDLDSYHPEPMGGGDVEDQIRALEARLDGLIQGAARSGEPGTETAPTLAVTDEPTGVTTEREAERRAEAIAVENTAELAGSQYYVQKWGRKGLRNRAEEVDEFGLNRSFEARLRPVLDFLYRRYFRIQTEGIENVPGEGRAVVVGNHSGSIPLDGLMLRAALRLDHPAGRDLRWLAEDFLFYLPFAGVFMNRAGAVRACQENAERLLTRDNLIGVFPEGVQGIRKLYRDRYRLQRFGRGGYIRLCLRTRAPLIPCAIIGGEEASPLLYRFDALADLLRVPYLPVTPTFPALGALGLLPAPTKWRIKFGEPIPFDNYGPEAADDHILVGRLSDQVRAAIQSMLDTGLRQRRSVWF